LTLVRRVHHIQLAAPPGSEEQARAFFVGVLGFEEVAKPPNLAQRGGAWFRGDGVEVHVGIDADFYPARKAHVAFEVDDVEQLRQHLQVHEIETWEDEPLPGYRRFYANDPFGNRLEFLSLS
jgi:catechol 2,3-dioxygenase-like lactoylglutathione lyase family enzyme